VEKSRVDSRVEYAGVENAELVTEVENAGATTDGKP